MHGVRILHKQMVWRTEHPIQVSSVVVYLGCFILGSCTNLGVVYLASCKVAHGVNGVFVSVGVVKKGLYNRGIV